jgi:hypothetical protein
VKKTCLLLLLAFLGAQLLVAQQPKKKTIDVQTWRVSELLATPDSIVPDTVHFNFQDANFIDRFSIANAYNGNMLSPIQSKIYFARPIPSNFLFSEAYFPYIQTINNSTFFNTKTPFSNVTYKSGGSTFRWEEEIKFFFTANFNKHLNFGVKVDYTVSHGEYAKQETQLFNPSLWGTYDGRRYKATGAVFLNSLSNNENGGIFDTKYITDPAFYGTPSENIEVKKQNHPAGSKYNYRGFYYNQQYCLGFDKEVKINADSSAFEYIPVTRFIHTLNLNEARKRYYEPTADTVFYANTYFNPAGSTRDTAAVTTMTNTFAVKMEEEFNKLMQFGLTAYVSNEITNYTAQNEDSTLTHTLFSNTRIGGILSKTRGRIFRYNLQGELAVQGYKAGNFLLQADLAGYFRLWNDSVVLRANGLMRLDAPDWFSEHYVSNHFRWNEDFADIYRTRLSGTVAIPTRKIAATVSVENVLNYVYFDKMAMPTQYASNIQILSADVRADFSIFKWLGLEANAVYQVSSQPDIIPLPALALYGNLYYKGLWFKQLAIQAGVNVRYHTAYFAPSYMPATGQFYVQKETKIGNYPIANAYLNFHLKQIRIFAEYYHVNQLIVSSGSYFSMPNYPQNPAIFKWGLSWNFYN